MAIKQLNTMFRKHNRVLFGAFTVIIIVSFLGFLTPGTFGFGEMSGPDAIKMGTAFGEKVTYGDLRRVGQNLSIFSEVFYGRPLGRDLPNEQLFGFFCMLKKAERLGIAVSDKEVAAFFRTLPLLQTNGKFDAAKYSNLLANLKRSGISESDFNDAMRMQLLFDKLQRELSSGVVATEHEAEELYRQLNTTYEVTVYRFENTAPESISFTQAQLESFFKAGRARYMVPGKFEGLVVNIPVAQFTAAAEKAATADALQRYFKKNAADFMGKDGKAAEFAKVEKQVRSRFVAAKARELAQRSAYSFASKVYETVSEQESAQREKSFRSIAAAAKLAVEPTGWVEFGADRAGKIKSRELVRSMAALSNGIPVTNVVMEENAALVGFVTRRINPRQAEFKEVAKQVLADYREAEAVKANRAAADKCYSHMLMHKDAAKRQQILAAQKVSSSKFSFTMKEPKLPNGMELAAQSVLDLAPGEFAPALPSAKGALLARLSARKAPDMKNFAAERARCMAMVRNQKLSLAMQGVSSELAANCRYEFNENNR